MSSARDAEKPGRYFRLHRREEDPRRLLDPEWQESEPWGGTIRGRCDKCGGSGETLHECESCVEGSADPQCPACHGKVRYRDTCPACDGSGEIDDTSREGVSVFPEEDALYRYMLRRDADLDGAVLVELEGTLSVDEDFDADEGALLVHPTAILDVREPDLRRMRDLRDASRDR